MCNLSQGIKEEGRIEGLAEGRVEGRAEGRVEGRAEGRAEEKLTSTIMHVQAMLERFPDMTATEAMDILKVEEELRANVLEILKKA